MQAVLHQTLENYKSSFIMLHRLCTIMLNKPIKKFEFSVYLNTHFVSGLLSIHLVKIQAVLQQILGNYKSSLIILGSCLLFMLNIKCLNKQSRN